MSWELVRHEKEKSGLFYVGHAEEAVFDVTLPPEELPGSSYFAEKVIAALVEQAKVEGEILETKVYYDPSSWYECKYRVVVVGHGSPLAWTPIIIATLAVIALVIIAWILQAVKDVQWVGVGLITVGVILGIGAIAFGVGYAAKHTRKRLKLK